MPPQEPANPSQSDPIIAQPPATPPATLPVLSPHTRDPKLLILGIAIVVAVMVLAALVLLRPGVLGTLLPGKAVASALPGTLTLELMVPATPTAETTPGHVSYIPSSGQTTPLPIRTVSGAVPLAFSNDGKQALAVRTSTTSTDLLRVNLESQQKSTLRSAPAGSSFASLMWSPDASTIVYTEVPSLKSLPLAPDGKPYFTPSGKAATLRAGLTLPAAYQSTTKLMHADGTGAVTIPGFPVLFSADGQHLLAVDGKKGFVVVAAADGKEIAVTGNVSFTDRPQLRVSPDGVHFAAVTKGGNKVVLYAIDWQSGSIASIGTIDGAQAVFSNDGTLLVVTGNTATTYSLASGAPVLSASYALTIPEGAQILSWSSL